MFFSTSADALGYSLFQKERAALSCKMSPVAQGPGETGETWTYPGMVLVPLCSNSHGVVAARRTKVPPWQPSITILYHPPTRSES